MTNPRPLLKLSLVPALCFLALGGCGKKNEEKVETLKTPSPVAMPKAAEPNSFSEVAARLDQGGAFYFYLSTEQWLAGLSQKIGSFRDAALSAVPGKPTDPDRAQAERAFKVVTDLVKKSGLEDVTGFGASSFALEPGVYRNKAFLHHYKGKGDGLIWSVFGKAPHKLDALDLLPADTALGGFGDYDIASLIAAVREGVEKSGIPEAKQAVDQGLAQFAAMTGKPLDEFLKSLGGTGGMIVTLDPAKPVALPIPEMSQNIPTPRLALLLQVKDDLIFNQIDQVLGAAPGVIKVDEPDLKMRTMAMPVPVLEVRATLALWGGFLVIASDDKLVRDIIAAKKSGKGLKSTPEFAKLSAGLPQEGNGFQVATQLFADTLNNFQMSMMKNQPGSTPEQAELMKKLLAYQKTGPTYAVSAHVENGWLVVSKGSQGASQMIAPMVIVPAAVAAAVAVPAFMKMKGAHSAMIGDFLNDTDESEQSKTAKSLSNAKQIGLGCKMYAADFQGKYPPALGALAPDYVDASVFVSPFAPEVPIGYTYTPGLTDSSPAATILLEDKFAAREHQRVILHADGSAEAKPAP